jgi:hypothetical protein
MKPSEEQAFNDLDELVGKHTSDKYFKQVPEKKEDTDSEE